jgi:hypothetical protein
VLRMTLTRMVVRTFSMTGGRHSLPEAGDG